MTSTFTVEDVTRQLYSMGVEDVPPQVVQSFIETRLKQNYDHPFFDTVQLWTLCIVRLLEVRSTTVAS